MPLILFLLVLAGCSGLEQSEKDNRRRLNAKGEFVYRNHDEFLHPIPPTKHQTREKYPWEETSP
jgi:hypothetical protein